MRNKNYTIKFIDGTTTYLQVGNRECLVIQENNGMNYTIQTRSKHGIITYQFKDNFIWSQAYNGFPFSEADKKGKDIWGLFCTLKRNEGKQIIDYKWNHFTNSLIGMEYVHTTNKN